MLAIDPNLTDDFCWKWIEPTQKPLTHFVIFYTETEITLDVLWENK